MANAMILTPLGLMLSIRARAERVIEPDKEIFAVRSFQELNNHFPDKAVRDPLGTFFVLGSVYYDGCIVRDDGEILFIHTPKNEGRKEGNPDKNIGREILDKWIELGLVKETFPNDREETRAILIRERKERLALMRYMDPETKTMDQKDHEKLIDFLQGYQLRNPLRDLNAIVIDQTNVELDKERQRKLEEVLLTAFLCGIREVHVLGTPLRCILSAQSLYSFYKGIQRTMKLTDEESPLNIPGYEQFTMSAGPELDNMYVGLAHAPRVLFIDPNLDVFPLFPLDGKWIHSYFPDFRSYGSLWEYSFSHILNEGILGSELAGDFSRLPQTRRSLPQALRRLPLPLVAFYMSILENVPSSTGQQITAPRTILQGGDPSWHKWFRNIYGTGDLTFATMTKMEARKMPEDLFNAWQEGKTVPRDSINPDDAKLRRLYAKLFRNLYGKEELVFVDIDKSSLPKMPNRLAQIWREKMQATREAQALSDFYSFMSELAPK